jgi:V8-like Glu-specific endopeptidase
MTISEVYGQLSTNASYYVKSVRESIGEQFSEHNQRFRSALSSMNQSMKAQVCPPFLCTQCSSLNEYLMCDVCCHEIESYEPVSLEMGVQQETGSSLLSKTNRLFLNSLEWIGLHPVYNGFRKKRLDETDSIFSLIQSFNWKYNPQFRSNRDVNMEDQAICGYYVEEGSKVGRVVGGKEVKIAGRYPWQLSLATGFFGFFYQHRCGATLISRRWVLTAAHCMQNMNLASTYVMAGFLAVNNRDTAQIKKIERYITHPRFDSTLYEQDIALLKLASPMDFSSLVLPACLPVPGASYTDKTATLTGWGREWDNGPLSNQLHEITLPVVSNSKCMDWYSNSGSRQYIPEDTFLCAGFEEGERDACSGDSGGPLVSFRDDQRAEVIGVVSWGLGCGAKGRPGVYTRVTKFIDWIYQTIAAHP